MNSNYEDAQQEFSHRLVAVFQEVIPLDVGADFSAGVFGRHFCS